MRSSPALSSRSSSLPKALTENGQVGSRNTSKTRGPRPQTSGSARHAFMRSFLYPVQFAVRARSGAGAGLPKTSLGYDKMPGAGLAERQNNNARDFGVSLARQRLLALAPYLPFVAEIISVDASTQTARPTNHSA